MGLPAFSNGHEQETQNSPPRAPHNYKPHPSPEMIWVTANFDGVCALGITADGKNQTFSLNRRQLYGLAEQVFGAMKKMEPGGYREEI